ncbi:MAG: hypothetical protein IPH12_17435 [Saprospirales bacterium]|nr:hypothetical protein [Saprospirales bacterium]MBK8920640.1 hypothetical protein [Saprospirales bacterium]
MGGVFLTLTSLVKQLRSDAMRLFHRLASAKNTLAENGNLFRTRSLAKQVLCRKGLLKCHGIATLVFKLKSEPGRRLTPIYPRLSLSEAISLEDQSILQTLGLSTAERRLRIFFNREAVEHE